MFTEREINEATIEALENECYEIEDTFDDDASLRNAIRDIMRQLFRQKGQTKFIDFRLTNGGGDRGTYMFRLRNQCTSSATSYVSCSNAYLGTATSDCGYAFYREGYDDLTYCITNILQAMEEAYTRLVGLD